MSGITTHVLDQSSGRPGVGIDFGLQIRGEDGNWVTVFGGVTDEDGRAKALDGAAVRAAVYRLRFEVEPYFAAQKKETFYPYVSIIFRVNNPDEHHHVPLLMSPFGYSTYRGS